MIRADEFTHRQEFASTPPKHGEPDGCGTEKQELAALGPSAVGLVAAGVLRDRHNSNNSLYESASTCTERSESS
jgi:hypothetical protein